MMTLFKVFDYNQASPIEILVLLMEQLSSLVIYSPAARLLFFVAQ